MTLEGTDRAALRATPRQLLLVFAVAGLAPLLFWNKAVHQDDWAYLRVAELLVQHGGDVLSQSTTYQGLPITVETGVMHGPVWLWVLALCDTIGGAAHQIGLAHLVSALCLGVLAASVASLAARVGARPVPTALALALAPAPLVLASGLMTDLPMVALFAASMACAVRGLETGRRGVLVGAGVLALLSGLTRYHGLSALPLLAALVLLWPNVPTAFRRRGWIAPAVALVGAVLYFALALAATGGLELARAQEGLGLAQIDHTACLLAAVAALGGVGLGLALGALAAPRELWRELRATERFQWARWLAMPLGAFFAVLGWRVAKVRPEGFVNELLHHGVFVLGALGLVLGLLPWMPRAFADGWRAWRERDGAAAWLSLWLGGFVIAAWWTLPFGATRYALPALPALFLLGGRLIARLPARAAWAGAACSAVLGVLAAGADHRAAAIYPRIAAEVAQRVAPGGAWHGPTTWIWGELGFRWYLESLAGLEVLPTASNAPREGDRILKSMVLSTASPDDGKSGRYRLHPEVVRRLESTSVDEFTDPWPVRIHNSHAGAGFYGADAGFLPFALSAVPHDRLQVWTVRASNPFLEGLEGAAIETAPGGFVRAQRFLVDPAQSQDMAVEILFPGRVTYRSVPVPEGTTEFAVEVGEHFRLTYEPDPRPVTVARVWLFDEVVAEQRFEARGDEPRLWYSLRADLSAHAGRAVDLAFQVVSDPPAPPDVPPARVNAGFANPRFLR
ncbi:MAG: hypothetical protein GC161_15900 [Planctomycetaceae bacterium]|nr:hypothetical protein [Planctomycetaceae bacterium]